jgi:hypothetical protein
MKLNKAARGFNAAPINYHHLSKMWEGVLGRTITPAQVALCMHQFYFSELVRNPMCRNSTVKMAEAIFAYEAIRETRQK